MNATATSAVHRDFTVPVDMARDTSPPLPATPEQVEAIVALAGKSGRNH